MLDLTQTHLYQEIYQQPEVVKRLIQDQAGELARLADLAAKHAPKFVQIAARGTSDNAGRYAQYLLGSANSLPVALATPSLFTMYGKPPLLEEALVIGISQSGKSPDIVAVLAEAHRQGALTAAFTNIPDSDLAQQADVVIDLGAGLEQAVAATKTYTAELAALALLSASLAHDAGMLAAIQRLPEWISAALEMDTLVANAVPRFRYMRDCVVIGRGYNYATAFELALKLKELTYTFVEPYSSADFLHGPLALIEHGFPAIVIAPSGAMLPELRSFMSTLQERGAEIVAISDDAETLSMANVPLQLPGGVPEWLSPITAIIPGQLLAMRLADIRNYNPDEPRNIRKVTETR